jgi:hypothetical protein
MIDRAELIRELCADEFDEIALIASELIATLEVLLAQHRASDKKGMLYSLARSSAFLKAMLLHEKSIRELRQPLYEQQCRTNKEAG